MKAPIIISALLILLCNYVEAQEYYPFPTEDAHWNIYVLTTCDNDSPPDTFLLRYTLQGDTTINDIAYNKLCLIKGDAGNPVYEGVGGLREEGKRIYYFGQGFLGSDPGQEMLLYDFTAQVGDTVQHSEKVSFSSIILEIDSIQIDGDYRKRYSIDNGWMYHNPDYIVEGIGSIQNGLLGHISDIPTCGTHYWEHVCFSEAGGVKYKNPAYSDCYAGTLKSYRTIFGKDATQWNYLTGYQVADLLYTMIYKAYDDTVVNAIHYRKLYEDSWLSGTGMLGMIREDTMMGRIWVRFFDDTTDFLIMDLSLEINDTFLLRNRFDPDYENVMVVTDIIQNQYRKTVVLDGEQIQFIEGIGPSLIFHCIDYMTYSELLCAYKDGIQIYNSIRDTCNLLLTLGLETSTTDILKIFPNPTSGMVTIETGEEGPCMVTISGLNGQLLFCRDINDPTFQVDLTPLRNGIYIISVRSQDYVFTRKIVKQ